MSWLYRLQTIEGTKIPITTMRYGFLLIMPSTVYQQMFRSIFRLKLQITGLKQLPCRQLVTMFPMLTPLTLFFKQFLHDQHLTEPTPAALPYTVAAHHSFCNNRAIMPAPCPLLMAHNWCSRRCWWRYRWAAEARVAGARTGSYLLGRLLLFVHFYGVVFDPGEIVVTTDLYQIVAGGRGRNDSGGSSVRWRSVIHSILRIL